MKNRIQVLLTDESLNKLETLYSKVKNNKTGAIKVSDLVSEIIFQSEINLEDFKIKYTSLKKSLLQLANSDNLDIDLAIKTLNEIKNKKAKKSIKPSQIQLKDNA